MSPFFSPRKGSCKRKDDVTFLLQRGVQKLMRITRPKKWAPFLGKFVQFLNEEGRSSAQFSRRRRTLNYARIKNERTRLFSQTFPPSFFFQGIRSNETDFCRHRNPCLNGGICLSTDSGAVCECLYVDFIGDFCETGNYLLSVNRQFTTSTTTTLTPFFCSISSADDAMRPHLIGYVQQKSLSSSLLDVMVLGVDPNYLLTFLTYAQ